MLHAEKWEVEKVGEPGDKAIYLLHLCLELLLLVIAPAVQTAKDNITFFLNSKFIDITNERYKHCTMLPWHVYMH